MKKRYSQGVQERKEAAKTDRELREAIESGEWRAEAYGGNWQEIDLDEFVAKFAPGCTPVLKDGKMVFQSPGSNLAIIADIGGGYCRLLDTSSTTKKRLYLDIDGKKPFNVVDEDGHQHGRHPDDRQAATHFRIRKRKDQK